MHLSGVCSGHTPAFPSWHGQTDTKSEQVTVSGSSDDLRKLNETLKRFLTSGDNLGSKILVDRIFTLLKESDIDEKTRSESYYFAGIFYLMTDSVNEAIQFLNLCLSLKEKNQEFDEHYATALYNLGGLYGRLGDYKRLEEYSIRSLDVQKKLYGDSSPSLISAYSNLIIAYLELQEYERSLSFASIALGIADNNQDMANSSDLANLYNNLGVLYNRLADYSKAKIFLGKSESIFKNSHLPQNANYINLMNNSAIAYSELGLTEKSTEYYEKGIALAQSNNSPLAFNTINSYAIVLGNIGKASKGEALLRSALERAKSNYGEDSRSYYEVLCKYADYLYDYGIDNNKAIKCYVRCLDYLDNHQEDILLKTNVLTGYSRSLSKSGEHIMALEAIQPLLFSDYGKNPRAGIYDNPAIDMIKPDRMNLRILRIKYNILWDIYKKTQNLKTLKAASNTAELIVSLLDKVRINISEEDSRLILGDRYRDTYLDAIRDFDILYKKTAEPEYLEKAFAYAEKSKVAGLLTSTRELRASQFHIPANVAEFERNLQRQISLFNARISEESVRDRTDTMLVNNLNESLLELTRSRDSLILVFENKYPGYYSIKYNTHVAGFKDIPGIAGRNGNYINYVLSDTILYIFIVNRKHQQLITSHIDSSLYNNIRQFRSLLLRPLATDNARIAFINYQSIGYELYKTLIEPVSMYLISNKILISPDNFLSYIPFEALPVLKGSENKILYRDLSYLMDKYDISYTYSATFLTESIKKNYIIGNKLIAFAPDYPDPIDTRSVLLNRQSDTGILFDLPYARQEAEYVSGITGGKLYEYGDAKESVFKAESKNYDIIHLAMHTLLNEKDPMYSTLIFSPENDTIEDRYLKTYEVYGIPLKAKMVVLSSCNTGSGMFYSGEGILSLARGFIYSGSQSVVMSMWEIEDRSGTEIVKMFYKNLKKGYPKSVALRKARMAYLKDADQLRSHPYFWSALIIYGNNTPLYYPVYIIIASLLLFLILIFLILSYLKKPKLS